MTFSNFNDEVDKWVNFANSQVGDYCPFDLALFKIFTVFEKYLSELFVNYLLGKKSEFNYKPTNKLTFTDQNQIETIFKRNNRFIDYMDLIENVSSSLFDNNPFEIIVSTVPYHNDYINCRVIRNYIAHESLESKKKYTANIFGDRKENFEEPQFYLKKIQKGSTKNYFSKYVDSILVIAEVVSGKTVLSN